MERASSNISSQQVHSQYDVKIAFKDSKTSDSIQVYAQKSILLKNSAYFAAQLSDRWADNCKEDENGRPILEIKECESPADYERALKKVYEDLAQCDGNNPVYRFQDFEDAVGCMIPADHLRFSALLDFAGRYLESIPWTDPQTQQLLSIVSRVNFPDAKIGHKLTKRTKPQMEGVRAALLDKVLAKAVNSESTTTVREARLFVEALIGSISSEQESKHAADELATGLQGTIFKLGVQLEGFAPPMKLERDNRKVAYTPGIDFVEGSFENHLDLSKLVGKLCWIFQLPFFPGQPNVMKEVVKVLTSIMARWDSNLYTWQIFHRYLAKDLYLPVMTAVREGRCILEAELRLELLRMWVPKVRTQRYRELHTWDMQDAFNAVLSTVSRYDQEQILHQWLDDLMGEDPWQPWFREWLEANLLIKTQALAFASTNGDTR